MRVYENLDREAGANASRVVSVAAVVATIVVDTPEGDGATNNRGTLPKGVSGYPITTNISSDRF